MENFGALTIRELYDVNSSACIYPFPG